MDSRRLRQSLPIGRIGDPLYFFSTIGSTNEYARELAEQGAPHGTLVVADEQTAGRGRSGKSWATPAGSALALSAVLRDLDASQTALAGLNVLGALAVVRALSHFRHMVEVKWPNDVLLEGRKVSGVLVEPLWTGDQLVAAVVGIGVNVNPEAVPPEENLDFPATSVVGVLTRKIDRVDLLLDIVRELDTLVRTYDLTELPSLCEPFLAYRGEIVRVEIGDNSSDARVLGLNADGRLNVEFDDADRVAISLEQAKIRPIDSRRI